MGKLSLDLSQDRSELDQALVGYLNEKFFDGEARYVASKMAAGSRMGGNSQGNEGDPSRRAGVSRLASSQLSEVEASAPMVVTILINEKIRLGDLAGTFALYLRLRSSDALCLCQDQVVPRVRVPGLEHPSAHPRAEQELQSERVRRELAAGQPRVQIP